MKSKLRLTYERFLAYFGDKLTGKEKHAFEKSVMQDDFESDAFDGLSKLSAVEIQHDLEELQQNLSGKIKSKQKKRIVWLPYAASIVLLLGLSLVLFYINQESEVNEFVSQDIEKKEAKREFESIPVTKQDSMETQSDQQEHSLDEEKLLDVEVVEDAEMEVMMLEDDQENTEMEVIKKTEIVHKRPIAKAFVEKEGKSRDFLSKKAQKSMTGKVVEVPTDSQIRARGVATLSKTGPKMYKHITGKVVDSNQDPIPGVSVAVKGTTQAVTTDIDGNFKMSLADNNTDYKLTASFVGFESKEIDVGDSLLVVLEQDVDAPSEVVVTAYKANDKKAYETGAVSEVELEKPLRSWNNAKPVDSKNIAEYKKNLISALQTKWGNELQDKYKIKVKFTVLDSGRVSDIHLSGDSNEALYEKIKELIRNGEKWIPAEKDDAAITSKVRFTLRLDFK
jgi:hypothetical protein